MMDLAHGKSVGYDWLAVRLAVLDDVCSVEQLQVPNPANAAATVVREQYLAPEDTLVQTSFSCALHVAPRILVDNYPRRHEPLALIESEHELEVQRLFAHDPDWVDRFVEPLCHAHEPDEGKSQFERPSERSVLGMVRVASAVLVALKAICPDSIDVLRGLARRSESGSDG